MTRYNSKDPYEPSNDPDRNSGGEQNREARDPVNGTARIVHKKRYNEGDLPSEAEAGSRYGSGSMRGNESTTNQGSYSQGNYEAPRSMPNNHDKRQGTHAYSNFIHYNYGTPEEQNSGTPDDHSSER